MWSNHSKRKTLLRKNLNKLKRNKEKILTLTIADAQSIDIKP